MQQGDGTEQWLGGPVELARNGDTLVATLTDTALKVWTVPVSGEVENVPSSLRAYLMVDAYPAAVATLE